MTNKEIARTLQQTGTLIELTGGNAFRARAFQRASRRLQQIDDDVVERVEAGTLTDIDGIGSGLAEQIEEIVRTGTFSVYQELVSSLPAGLPDLLDVKGLGTKKVRTIWQELGITTLDELEHAAEAGQLTTLNGFGKKTQENVLTRVRQLKQYRTQRRINEATEWAEEMLDQLRSHPAVERAELTGALRRHAQTVSCLELIVICDDAEALADPLGLSMDSAPSPTLTGELPDGLPLTIHLSEPKTFGSDWCDTTGSSAHLKALHSRLETSLSAAFEEAVYAAADLAWIPPALREGRGECAAAADGRLPELITDEDLRGTLHNHTTFSDGAHSLDEMVQEAQAMGLEYFGLCDHSRSLTIANGLSIERLQEQGELVRRINQQVGPTFRVFHGTESDILDDGSLDYPDDVLASLDLVVASIHSGFSMSKAEATDRLIRAIENPHTTILGHPTGRLLLRREGYPVNHEAIIEACAEHGVAIELNANPYRLDIDWRFIRQAVEAGVMISINPDAHSTDQLHYTRWGVTVAQKGWLPKKACLNALPLDAFVKWLDGRN